MGNFISRKQRESQTVQGNNKPIGDSTVPLSVPDSSLRATIENIYNSRSWEQKPAEVDVTKPDMELSATLAAVDMAEQRKKLPSIKPKPQSKSKKKSKR